MDNPIPLPITEKTLTSFQILTYAWVIGLSTWGGLVNYISKIKSGAIARFNITDTIRNNSGGSLGTCTFAAGYKTTGSWTQPGNGKSRSIVFVYDGTNWNEQFRSAADINL